MANDEIGRRQFLLAAAGGAVLTRLVSAYAPSCDPGAKFEISVSDQGIHRAPAEIVAVTD